MLIVCCPWHWWCSSLGIFSDDALWNGKFIQKDIVNTWVWC